MIRNSITRLCLKLLREAFDNVQMDGSGDFYEEAKGNSEGY